MRFFSFVVQEKGGSMPFGSVVGKGEVIVAVGAIDRRCELRMPFCGSAP